MASLPHTRALSTLLPKALLSAGSLGDANCNVEAVEFANSAQLSSILTQLLNSTYFRLFKVSGRARTHQTLKEESVGVRAASACVRAEHMRWVCM
jgi:hypothetical protein